MSNDNMIEILFDHLPSCGATNVPIYINTETNWFFRIGTGAVPSCIESPKVIRDIKSSLKGGRYSIDNPHGKTSTEIGKSLLAAIKNHEAENARLDVSQQEFKNAISSQLQDRG